MTLVVYVGRPAGLGRDQGRQHHQRRPEIAYVATFFFGWVGWVGWQVALERAEKPTSPVEGRHDATLRRSCELEIETYGEIVSPSLRDWWLANEQDRSGS